MAKKYQYTLLHLAFFYGSLITGSSLLFLALSALSGLFPRTKQSFLYYFILAIAALVLAFFLSPPEAKLIGRMQELLPLGPVPFPIVVGLISALTMVFTAMAVNRLVQPKSRSFSRN